MTSRTKKKPAPAELLKYAYAASHDLIAPLRRIGSFGELLQARLKGRLDPVELDYLERLRNSAADATRIVDDLMTLCRILCEDFPIEAVDLNAVLAGVQADSAAAIAAAGARIEAGPLPVLNGQAPLLDHILRSLISNALRFRRPDRPPLIRIDSRRNAEGVEISVADNGIGFEPGYAEKIFEPFLRLHAKGEYPGNGLGLTIARAAATRCGGGLTAESEPGRGAAFTFRLPAAMVAR